MGEEKQEKVIREFSSGGAVFKNEQGKTLWLIARTSPSDLFPNTVWRIPKGWIDDEGDGIAGPMASGKVKADENSLQEAAIREVREEGGVDAKIVKKIKTINYMFNFPGRGRIFKFVTFYLMEWLKDLPEGFDNETSEIAWLEFEEAYAKLSFNREKEILKDANELIKEVKI